MLLVGGVTYDHTTNYGSCLQAYALKTAIESYSIGSDRCEYYLVPLREFKEFPSAGILKSILIIPFWKLHRTQFKPFEKKYMKYFDVSKISELPSLNEKADAFVCGSDVIWNPDFNFGLGAFYLDFAKKYKFSYAASFGKSDLSEQSLRAVKDKISALDAISVREESGAAIARSLTDQEVKVVLDPVLLLNREKWDEITEDTHQDEDYIFVYTTHLNHTIQAFISRLNEKTGLKVILSTNGPKQALKQGIVQVQSPQRWLSLLKGAKYVVTNSFHATAFSVIYHRNFYTVVGGEKNKGINVRMNDLLTFLGLSDRIFSSVPDGFDLSDINFQNADEKIDALREESLQYLHQNLENAYQRKNGIAKGE